MEERRVNKMGSFGDQSDFDCPDGAHRVGDKGSAMLRNHHPTVKPLALMRYLVRLTKTPTGGLVLDPFAGSGTTGMACVMEGRDFVGVELDESYCAIARARIAEAAMQRVLL
jgi:site-specific DNA-methyltransferase (adenine-specific)